MRCHGCGLDNLASATECVGCHARIEAAAPSPDLPPPDLTAPPKIEVAPSAGIAKTSARRAAVFFEEVTRSQRAQPPADAIAYEDLEEVVPEAEDAPEGAIVLEAPVVPAAAVVPVPDAARVVRRVQAKIPGAVPARAERTGDAAGLRCPACERPIDSAREPWDTCARCRARHHVACWHRAGECARCGSSTALAPPPGTRTGSWLKTLVLVLVTFPVALALGIGVGRFGPDLLEDDEDDSPPVAPPSAPATPLPSPKARPLVPSPAPPVAPRLPARPPTGPPKLDPSLPGGLVRRGDVFRYNLEGDSTASAEVVAVTDGPVGEIRTRVTRRAGADSQVSTDTKPYRTWLAPPASALAVGQETLTVSNQRFECTIYETTGTGDDRVRFWFAQRYPYLLRQTSGDAVVYDLVEIVPLTRAGK